MLTIKSWQFTRQHYAYSTNPCGLYVAAGNSLVIVIGYRSPAVMGDSYVAAIGYISLDWIVRSCGGLIEFELGLLVDNPVLVAPVSGGFQDLWCCLKWDENHELLGSTMHQHVLRMYLNKANSVLLRTQPPNRPAFKLLPNVLSYMAVLSGHMCKHLNVAYIILADCVFRWQGRILS